MKKSTRKYYTARWASPGHPSIADVSFFAGSDEVAIRRANSIAIELNVTRTPRTLYEGSRHVHSVPRSDTPKGTEHAKY